MATSLVSTGVQFPDATIQTTAATASAPSPMVLLTTTTASGATSYNLFTSSFSNTYTQYLMTYQINKPTAAFEEFKNKIQLIVDGSTKTTNYIYIGTYWQGAGGGGGTAYTYASSSSGTSQFPNTYAAGDSEKDYVTIEGELQINFARNNSQKLIGFNKMFSTYHQNYYNQNFYTYGWANKSTYTNGVTGIFLDTGSTAVTVTASLYGIVI